MKKWYNIPKQRNNNIKRGIEMTKISAEVRKQLSDAMKIIIGYNSIAQFAQKCRIPNIRMITDLLEGNINELPDRKLLRKLAAASEGRVTHTYLYYICGYSENDSEEDRSWAEWVPKRGEIYYCDLGHNLDCEQSGIRPVIIIQNDVGNQHSPSVVVIPCTSKKKFSPKIHVHIGTEYGMKEDTYALVEQIRCVSKRRFFFNSVPWRISTLPEEKMEEIQNALEFELGFEPLAFDEEKAFRMVEHLKALKYNIQNKKSHDLIEIFNEKFMDLSRYCKKHRKNYKYIFGKTKDFACAG